MSCTPAGGGSKYRAPSHTSPDPSILEKLLSDQAWTRVVVGPSATESSARLPSPEAPTSSSEKLHKEFKFRNFKEAWSFMGIVADKAEELNVRERESDSEEVKERHIRRRACDVQAWMLPGIAQLRWRLSRTFTPAPSGVVQCEGGMFAT